MTSPFAKRNDIQTALEATDQQHAAARRMGFEAVPAEIREEMAQRIIDMPVLTRSGIQGLSQYIMAQLIRGTITTAQADSARKWVELMMTNLTLDMFEKNPAYQKAYTPGNGGAGVPAQDVMTRLHAAEKQSRKITKKLVIDADFED